MPGRMEQTDGHVTDGVRGLLRLEGLGLMLAALAFYSVRGGDWWLAAKLFLAPDLSFVFYLFGPRLGAIAYNAAHSTLGALTLAAFGQPMLAAIWLAHIGFDRALGFGLKYPSAFRHTHLGNL